MNNREQRIRDRAHALWEAEGGIHGRHEDHWRQAEQEIDRGNAGDLSSEMPTPSELDMEPTTLPDSVGGGGADQDLPPARMGKAAKPKKPVEAAGTDNPVHHSGEQPLDPLMK